MSNPQYGEQQPGGYPQTQHGPGGQPPLWAPWYGIGFPQAFVRVFRKYADFTGRASRGEYWWFVVWNLIISVVLSIIGSVIDAATGSTGQMMDMATRGNPSDLSSLVGASFTSPGNWIAYVWSLAILIPGWSLTARRLHDVNRSGWWQLIAIIPIIGAIVLLVWYATSSRPEGARFDRPRG